VHDPLSPIAIELGAEFIHGRPAELWSLAADAGLALCEIPDRGGDSPLDRVMDELGKRPDDQPDESFQSFLDRGDYSDAERAASTGFVEGFNAARKDDVSALWLAYESRASDAIEGDRSFRVLGGYDQVPLALYRKVRLSTAAERIEWRRGEVTVHAGSTLRARAVLVPLGVLQSGAIRFDPAPGAILEAAGRLCCRQALRLALRFEKPFWDRAFYFSDEPEFPTWWTPLPVHAR
jgi:hypothetical protein